MAGEAFDSDGAARAFYELSKRLKVAEKGVRAQFHRSIREAAKPVLPAIRQAAASRFPARGGLNQRMSKASRYRAVAKTGAQTAGVSIRANKTDPRIDSEGRIMHPVPDGRGGWLRDKNGRRLMVVQHVPAAVGFFSRTIAEQAPAIREDMVARMEQWATDNLSGTIRG